MKQSIQLGNCKVSIEIDEKNFNSIENRKKNLNDYSIKELKEIANSGKAPQYFNIGDKLNITLNDGEILTVAIADFNHDVDEKGKIIPITFTAVNVLEESCSMDEIDYYLKNLFDNRIPSELKEAIVPINKEGKIYKLFLHNEVEIFGETIYSNDDTGTQYPYYKEKCHRCKFKNSKNYSAYWWERSACYGNSYAFCNVDDDGGAYISDAYTSLGVAPAFGF